MNILICNDFTPANLDEMREVYASVGWKKHNPEVIQQVFGASNVIALVYVNGRIIGFGRAMSDGIFNAAIYDIVVHKDYQGHGIAKKVMEYILNQLKDVSCVHLISTTGNEEFYNKSGFKKLKTGMARYLNSDLRDEYLE